MLAKSDSRLRHSCVVAKQSERASLGLTDIDQIALVSAAWLHDIGYGETAVDTGFHPLDGARYLEHHGVPRRVINLVANHSCARFEADKRGMLRELEPYDREVGAVPDALIWADMTTGPTGHTVGVEDRLAEILRRYAVESPVHRAIEEASDEIIAAVGRVELRLSGSG